MTINVLTSFDHFATIADTANIDNYALDVGIGSLSFVSNATSRVYGGVRKITSRSTGERHWWTWRRGTTGATSAFMAITPSSFATANMVSGSRIIVGFRLYGNALANSTKWLMWSATAITTTTTVETGINITNEECYVELVFDFTSAGRPTVNVYVNTVLTNTLTANGTTWSLQIGETNGTVVSAANAIFGINDIYVRSSIGAQAKVNRLNPIRVHKDPVTIQGAQWITNTDATPNEVLAAPVAFQAGTTNYNKTSYVFANNPQTAITLSTDQVPHLRKVASQTQVVAFTDIKDVKLEMINPDEDVGASKTFLLNAVPITLVGPVLLDSQTHVDIIKSV